MFQAKGSPIWGTQEKNVASLAEKLPKEKLLVFNLTKEDVSAPGEASIIKADLSLEKFREGVDCVVAALQSENDKTSCLFVANTPEEAVSGMITAFCVKSVQTIVKMKSMIEDGITEKEWTEKLIKRSFEEGQPEEKVDRYDIIDSLVKKLSSGELGKILADKAVDLCEEKINLRNSIKTLKEEFDKTESFEKKMKTLEILERYFYAVCIGSYVRGCGEDGFKLKFSEWVKENSCVSEMIEHGIRFWKDMTFFSLASSPRSAAA